MSAWSHFVSHSAVGNWDQVLTDLNPPASKLHQILSLVIALDWWEGVVQWEASIRSRDQDCPMRSEYYILIDEGVVSFFSKEHILSHPVQLFFQIEEQIPIQVCTTVDIESATVNFK